MTTKTKDKDTVLVEDSPRPKLDYHSVARDLNRSIYEMMTENYGRGFYESRLVLQTALARIGRDWVEYRNAQKEPQKLPPDEPSDVELLEPGDDGVERNIKLKAQLDELSAESDKAKDKQAKVDKAQEAKRGSSGGSDEKRSSESA